MPDTTSGVHVFNDQTAAWSDGLRQFAATHYAGTQKQTRAEADALRAIDPGFVILHYRLGTGLGYRVTSAPCNPGGDYFHVIDGNWVQEWPGEQALQESWFYHQLGQRVLYCPLGWYLMDVANAGYRQWWSNVVMSQMANNDNDGLFADSFTLPNFMTSTGWDPDLPAIDLDFEAEWSQKLEGFMTYLRGRFGDQYYLIPNIGMWVTTRDETDYSIPDGVFIEWFANEPWEWYGFEGWATQGERVLSLTSQGKILIGQTESLWSPERRMFAVASYLLWKNDRSYINLELGMEPEWYPEYEVPIGAPTQPPTTLDALRDPATGLYRRAFTNGLVVVNPTAQTRTMQLPGTLHRATANGGGFVPSSGVLPDTWKLTYQPVTQVTLAAGAAAVLVDDPQGGDPGSGEYGLDATAFVAGQPAQVTVTGGTPGEVQHVFVSRGQPGTTPWPDLGVLLDLEGPRLVGLVPADGTGTAVWPVNVPHFYAGIPLRIQAAEPGRKTPVIERTVQ